MNDSANEHEARSVRGSHVRGTYMHARETRRETQEREPVAEVITGHGKETKKDETRGTSRIVDEGDAGDKRVPRDSGAAVRINKSSRRGRGRARGTNARELLIAYDRAELFIPGLVDVRHSFERADRMEIDGLAF